MKPCERITAALNFQPVDRVPRMEVWIDALYTELGITDPDEAHPLLGQDCILLPTRSLPGSPVWKDGVDEWGRIWKNGMYTAGLLATPDDMQRYSVPLERLVEYFDPQKTTELCQKYPDHFLITGTHNGPFTASYLSMGIERFFYNMLDQPELIHRLMQARTAWCIAYYQHAVKLGAKLIILGEDAGQKNGPMISPRMWRQFVLPYHQQIIQSVNVPVIWHSDGNILALLPMAIEAGFRGIHGIEPAAGMDLFSLGQQFQDQLVLVGNVDVRTLCQQNLDLVTQEIQRCYDQGKNRPGYMLSTCNSIFNGMNAAAVTEYFRFQPS